MGSVIQMTFLTQLRGLADEHCHLIAAVHFMAQSTVFDYRWVFDPERTSLFGMAAIAEFVNAVGFYHLVSESPVGIVAIGAFNLPFRQRVVRLPAVQHPYTLVTIKTEVGLGLFQAFFKATVAMN